MENVSSETWRVLLVDDDKDDYLITRDMFAQIKGQKVIVEWASTYQAGKQLMQAKHYDAVLVDYELDHRTGIDLIREVNAQNYTAPMILYTGRGSFEIDVKAMEAGASLYLAKEDANPLMLERFIRYATQHKRIEQELVHRLAEQATILDSIQDGLFGVDRNWNFTYINPRAASNGGFAPEDLVGRNIWETFPRLKGTLLEENYRHVMVKRTPCNFEIRGAYNDLWYNVAVYPSMAGISVYWQDITERKQAEDDLRLSEERFYKAFNASRNAQVISRIEDGQIEIVNNSFEQLFGYSRDEVIGKTSLELNMIPHPEDRQEAVRQLRENGFVRDFELEFQTKAGEIRLASLSLEMIAIGKHTVMLTIMEDITKRRQAEETLRESEERFRTIFERAEFGIVLGDLEGRIIESNAAFERMLGYSKQELYLMPFSSFTHPEDLNKEWPLVEELIAGKRDYYEVEKRYIRKDGQLVDVRLVGNPVRDSTGNPKLGIALIENITERKRIEEALQVSQAAMDAFFETSPGILNLFDHELRYIKTDPITPTYFGLDHHSIIGKSVKDLNPPFVEQFLGPMIQRITQTGQPELNLEVPGPIPSKQGEIGYWHVSYFPVPLPNGERGLGVMGVDITELKRAGEALLESERQLQETANLLEIDRSRLAAILENLPVGVWIADQDGQLVGKNEQADRIWAGDAPLLDSVEKYQTYTAWYPNSGQVLLPEEYPLVKALQSGKSVEPIELGIRRFDGTEGNVLVSAAPIKNQEGVLIGAVGVNMDITERKRVEERYTTLFNTVREGFAYYKAIYNEEGKLKDIFVKEINPAGAAISGVSREVQIGKTWSQVWPGLDHQLFAIYQRVDETGEMIRFDDHNRVTGRIYDVVIFRTVPGEFVVTFSDITERKQAEEALAAYTRDLERSNRDLQEFAFVASHDLQEPLRKIEAFGDMLMEKGGSLDALQRDIIVRMRKSAKRMRSMVDGLLQLSRLETHAQPFQPIDLNIVLAEVLSDLEMQIQQSSGSVAASELPIIEADPGQMHRLLLNIINNALKFQPPGGKPQVAISSRQPTLTSVEILIHDNGIGFDEAFSDQIYAPFERLVGNDEYEGSGIGLSICRKIVERHRGTIKAHSQSGQGATFIVTLPIHQDRSSKTIGRIQDDGDRTVFPVR